MKEQLSILMLTTTLLLATSSYAFNDRGRVCDRNNHERWSQINTTPQITLISAVGLKNLR